MVFGEQPMSIVCINIVNLVFCYVIGWGSRLTGLLDLPLPSFLYSSQSGHVNRPGRFSPPADDYTTRSLGMVLYSEGFQHESSHLIFTNVTS